MILDYTDNGYSNFLNIDSLTVKLGTFGNETINSVNVDAFIEDDALPEAETGSDTGYNVKIVEGRVQIRDGTSVNAYFGIGSTPLSEYPADPTDIYFIRTGQILTSDIKGDDNNQITFWSDEVTFYGQTTIFCNIKELHSLGGKSNYNFLIYPGGSTTYTPEEGPDIYYNSTKSVKILASSLSPASGISVGLGQGGNGWNELWLKINTATNSQTSSAVIRYYKSGATEQFRGWKEASGTIYSFDLTAV